MYNVLDSAHPRYNPAVTTFDVEPFAYGNDFLCCSNKYKLFLTNI